MWDPNNDRPMSGVFRNPQLSVDRDAMRPCDICCQFVPDNGFALLAAKAAMNLGLEVRKDPIGLEKYPLLKLEHADDYNPAHALILGTKSHTVGKKLRDAVEAARRPGECSPSATDAA